MTAVADALAAVIAIAKADASVAALVGARVYGESLPQADSASMPRKALVLKQSGGVEPSYTTGTIELQAQRLDALCYGENTYEAGRVRRALRGAFRAVQRRTASAVLVHWIRPAGASITFIDGDAQWPGVLESYQVLSSELAAA
jgi:hypothetical protein